MRRFVGCAVLLIVSVAGSWGRARPVRTALNISKSPDGRLQGQAAPAAPEKLPSIAQKTAGFEKLAGYFNLYWDARQGKLWLEISQWNTEFLYVDSLPQGVGSNDIGLDRLNRNNTAVGSQPLMFDVFFDIFW